MNRLFNLADLISGKALSYIEHILHPVLAAVYTQKKHCPLCFASLLHSDASHLNTTTSGFTDNDAYTECTDMFSSKNYYPKATLKI